MNGPDDTVPEPPPDRARHPRGHGRGRGAAARPGRLLRDDHGRGRRRDHDGVRQPAPAPPGRARGVGGVRRPRLRGLRRPRPAPGRHPSGAPARGRVGRARSLRDEYGVGPGDRVAILAANCPEWIVTFWATVSLGAIAVGLNGWWVGDEIRYGIDDCDPEGARRRPQAARPPRRRGPRRRRRS